MKALSGIIAAFVALAIVASPVMAATTIDTTWSGSGIITHDFYSGDDAETHIYTSGSTISGEFHGVDSDDNPYGYGVDTTDAKIKSHVVDGIIEYDFKKTDNYDRMYGPAGQESYTLIDTYGTGDFAWHTNSNYAQLRNSNYGWQSNNQIQATGLHHIYHSFFIDDEYNEGAEIEVTADADTSITDMCEDHWGSSYKFGKGCGCYTNAKVDITNGAGTFDLHAYGDNQITTDNGITVTGPGAHLNVHGDFGNGFHYSNFALEGN